MAIRKMLCDYLEIPKDGALADLELYQRIAYWAGRVCLEPEDIYDETEECPPEGMPFQDPADIILAAREPARKRYIELERGLEENFLVYFREECSLNLPLVGLFDDYLHATPIEKAMINLVLRRLTNLSFPRF